MRCFARSAHGRPSRASGRLPSDGSGRTPNDRGFIARHRAPGQAALAPLRGSGGSAGRLCSVHDDLGRLGRVRHHADVARARDLGGRFARHRLAPAVAWLRSSPPRRLRAREGRRAGIRRRSRLRLRFAAARGRWNLCRDSRMRHRYGKDEAATDGNREKSAANRLFRAAVGVSPRNEGVPGSSPGVGFLGVPRNALVLRRFSPLQRAARVDTGGRVWTSVDTEYGIDPE
jgi:hypothetical protein